ncbi:MAG TPA: hypothetical protein PKK10_12965 [Woeseiaceae bacterium]|nr:hypothetical protein [Woeseiaceae bacterium]
MWKRTFWILASIGVLCGAGGAVSAEPVAKLGAEDACSVVDNLVYNVIASDGIYRRHVTSFPLGTITTDLCMNTAKAVSSGFSRAMSEMNIYVTWQSPRRFREHVCLSVDLSQCYPMQDPYVPFGYGDAAYVRDSWFAVQRAMQAFVRQDAGPDTTQFSASQLQRQLRLEMKHHVRGAIQQYYFR